MVVIPRLPNLTTADLADEGEANLLLEHFDKGVEVHTTWRASKDMDVVWHHTICKDLGSELFCRRTQTRHDRVGVGRFGK